MSNEKDTLHEYLRTTRDALIGKLDGLSEYDVRRPLVPTGTNLLGLVKHVASVTAEYFGTVFGRPFPTAMPWMAQDAEPNADMWATEAESREEIVALYHRAWAHAGHADLVRELIDGTTGLRSPGDNVVGGDEAWWKQYHDRLESTARSYR